MNRRIAAFALCIVMVMGLCACGADQPAVQQTVGTDPEITTTASGNSTDSTTQVITAPETTVPETTMLQTVPVTSEPETHPVVDHVHSYTSKVYPLTCTRNGYTVYTCAECGHMYTDDIVEASGHAYQEQKTPPTCTQNGYSTNTCTVCGDSFVIPEYGTAGHRTTTAQIIAPTCTEAGYALKTCSVCGKQTKEKMAEPLGHSYTIHNAVLPGCIQMGYTEHTCDVCGHSYTDGVLDAIGHIWGPWTTVEEPTHTSAGREERKCVVCNEIHSRTVDALPKTDS